MERNVDFTLENGIIRANIRFLKPGTNNQLATAQFNWNHSQLEFGLVAFQTQDIRVDGGLTLVSGMSNALNQTVNNLDNFAQNETWLNFVSGTLGPSS